MLEQPIKKSNKSLLVSIVIVILLVGGAGASAYFYNNNSPEKVAQKVADKIAQVKTLEYNGTLETEINIANLIPPKQNAQQKSPTTITSSTYINGRLDISDLNNPKNSMSFVTSMDGQSAGKISMEVKSLDGASYVKLGGSAGTGSMKALQETWIKVDLQALQKQYMPKGLEGILGNTNESLAQKQKLTESQAERLKLAFSQAKIIKTTGILPDEKIDGVNSYHYKLMIDKEELKKFYASVLEISQDKTLSEKDKENIYKVFDSIDLYEGEIWIGKSDLLPRKISAQLITKSVVDGKSQSKVSFTVFMKNFNMPVIIEAPISAKTIEQFTQELMPAKR
ncbi:MAG: hypothetical protein M3Q34_03255 [bacterium]|nr:hypothetical protein [bacterium]